MTLRNLRRQNPEVIELWHFWQVLKRDAPAGLLASLGLTYVPRSIHGIESAIAKLEKALKEDTHADPNN